MKGRAASSLVKETFTGWREDKVSRMAASLAYYTVFSLAPLLVICVAMAGLFFGTEAAEGRLVSQLGSLVGDSSAHAIQAMIAAARRPSSGIVAAVLGTATLVFGATGVFAELQDSLNTIWEVAPKPGRGAWRMLRTRFVSFAMVLGIGFLLLVSLVVSAGLAALGELLGGLLPVPEVVLHAINTIVSFGVVTVLFAMIFKFLPDVKIAWRDVWIGALITTALFTLGKLAIGLYLGHSAVASGYGAAGALVLILLWVYYSSQILFIGAEFTRAYATAFGSRIRPARDAEPLTDEARAQIGIRPTLH